MLAFIGDHFLVIPVIAVFLFTTTLGSVTIADAMSHRGS
jgi:hypothetical protein